MSLLQYPHKAHPRWALPTSINNLKEIIFNWHSFLTGSKGGTYAMAVYFITGITKVEPAQDINIHIIQKKKHLGSKFENCSYKTQWYPMVRLAPNLAFLCLARLYFIKKNIGLQLLY